MAGRDVGRGLVIGVVAITVIFAVLTVYVGTRTPPNVLATALLQAFTFVIGVAGAYVFALYADSKAADSRIKAYAKPAFRRTRNLYRAIGQLKKQLVEQSTRLDLLTEASDHEGFIHREHVKSAFITLNYSLDEMLSTAEDTVEDWRDLAPEEVEEILTQVEARKKELSDE